ncbi:protein binding protein, putative [Ricinus communis]|uniref:Protein binding protein, putative n=1 Tax=Ricinus communis TaxID=3988 RepID=B9RVP2_RICCO|nr:protein binding protein, putative [Ricinus communis]
MAFHVACPITCRRICYCALGFPRDLQNAKSKAEFLLEVSRIEEFLKDPFRIRDFDDSSSTVQVLVPKVLPVPAPPPPAPSLSSSLAAVPAVGEDGGGGGGLGEEASAHTKRVALQKKAAAAMVAAEDYARRFESGDMAVATKDVAGHEQGLSNANVMCRMCFLGEAEGSERARRMLSCKSCGKKYHRSCLKSWAQHRDLFHWSSWTCPSCRICEICRRTGDPNKFMFCKRCDGAYHCYCQHPPHKNVSSGPYLCPKHTRCHSCGSSVPGNGLSVRWFLGYTCCDACGRLFVKGNYCPVCLKVYRDSESTPMVCCDICQRWVHCSCDGISDEKYLQFQVDGNLQYKCATCRGECYQVKDHEDAVQELWRRRDEADRGVYSSSIAGVVNHAEGNCSVNQTGVLKHKYVDEVMVSDGERTSRIVRLKNKKPHDLDSGDDAEKHAIKFKSVKAKKLVINLGARKINVTNSHRSDASSCQRDQDMTTPNGDTVDHSVQIRSLKFPRREGNFIKFGKVKNETSNLNPKFQTGSDADGEKMVSVSSSKRSIDGCGTAVGPVDEVPTLRSDKVSIGKQLEVRSETHAESNDDSGDASLPKDSKISLKLKIKNPNLLNQYSRKPPPEEEKSSIRGQRSKRKRPSSFMDKSLFNENEDITQAHQDSEMLEASWILKKLGKDAIGKRVEVHQPSDNSWHKGVVSDTVEGTSMISVTLDDSRVKTLQLGKQAVRFVPQKQKRSREG